MTAIGYQSWSVTFNEQPTFTKWNILGTNDDYFNTSLTDGWVDAHAETWTYATATTFTISGDKTSKYQAGDIIRLKQGGAYKYFYIVSVSYSSPNTTITVKDGIDGVTYTLAIAGITDNWFSKSSMPFGLSQNATRYDKARLTKSSNQSLTGGLETTLTWDQETFDTGNLHDNVTNNSRLTIIETGYYLITLGVEFADGSDTSRRYISIVVNGGSAISTAAFAAINGQSSHLNCSAIYHLAAGDYVTATAQQDKGSPLNVNSGRSHFEISRLA